MSRTISVFEHGLLRVSADADGGLTQAEFEALVRFNDEHRQVYFNVGHRSVLLRQYVGYLQVGDLGIEVLPKADKNATAQTTRWRAMLHEMLRVGLGMDLQSTDAAEQTLTRRSLIELVVGSFVPKVERLLREGLARGYREVEANATTFRGKLVFADHLRLNHCRADRCFVRYSTYEEDIFVNRLVRAGLEVSARAPISGPLRGRVSASLLGFERVARSLPSAEAFDRLQPTRATHRYRGALLLARMLVENLSPALRGGQTRVFAFLFDMNLLWERYVRVLVRRASGSNVRVVLQAPRAFLIQADRPNRSIRPDILLVDARSGTALAVLDTKWKVVDARGPDDDHLKQMFVYNEMFGSPRAILVQPAGANVGLLSLGTYSQRSHRCDVLGLGFQSTRAASSEIVRQLHLLIEKLTQPAPEIMEFPGSDLATASIGV